MKNNDETEEDKAFGRRIGQAISIIITIILTVKFYPDFFTLPAIDWVIVEKVKNTIKLVLTLLVFYGFDRLFNGLTKKGIILVIAVLIGLLDFIWFCFYRAWLSYSKTSLFDKADLIVEKTKEKNVKFDAHASEIFRILLISPIFFTGFYYIWF